MHYLTTLSSINRIFNLLLSIVLVKQNAFKQKVN